MNHYELMSSASAYVSHVVVLILQSDRSCLLNYVRAYDGLCVNYTGY